MNSFPHLLFLQWIRHQPPITQIGWIGNITSCANKIQVEYIFTIVTGVVTVTITVSLLMALGNCFAFLNLRWQFERPSPLAVLRCRVYVVGITLNNAEPSLCRRLLL